MATIGELKESSMEFQWKIKDFFSLSEEVYSSSLFAFGNQTWCLRIYPNGRKIDNTNGYINVFLRKKSYTPSISVEFSFSFKTSDKKKVLEKNKTSFFEAGEWSEGFGKFVSRSELSKRKPEFAPSDILTIICTLNCPKATEDRSTSSDKSSEDEAISENKLSKKEEDIAKKKVSPKIKGLEILSENLKQVLLDGRMTDAVLKADGQEFRVHKIILVARSPVFASMFEHNLAEKNTNEVDIPDCTAESFEVFLHYLYSGSVETLSSSNVYNAYYAADKYQVDDLKEKCASFMMENISVETFCDVIELSLRHGEFDLQKIATDFFCQNIKKIIKTVQWQKYLEENSTQANELLIKALNA